MGYGMVTLRWEVDGARHFREYQLMNFRKSHRIKAYGDTDTNRHPVRHWGTYLNTCRRVSVRT